MSTFGRVVKGSALMSVSSAVVNALGALSTVALARLLMPEDFGIFAIGSTIIVILSSVTDLSIGQALIQRDEVTEDHLNTAWTLNFLRVVPIGLVLMAVSPLIASTFDEPRVTPVLLALAGGWMMLGFLNPRFSLFEKKLEFGRQVILNIAQKLVGVVVTVVIAAIYQTYWSLVIGTIASSAVRIVASYYFAPFMPRFCLKGARELFSFSAWATLSQIVNTLNWRIDLLLIGKFLNVQDIGYYTVGSNLALLPTREAIAPLTKTLFPGFASLKADRDRLRRAYQRAQTFVTAVSLPVGIGVALLADPLVRLALGDRWLEVIFIIQALSVIYGSQTIGSQVQSLAMAQGETRTLFWRSVQLMVIRLPLIIAGLFLGGIKGMVIARALSAFIGIWINLVLVRRLVDLSVFEQLRANARALISVAVMSGCVLVARTIIPHDPANPFALALELGLLSTLGAAVYFACSYMLWTIAGRPSGPEEDAWTVFMQFKTRFKLAKQR